jgi:hypothetical protein
MASNANGRARILLIGLGDLGRRLSLALAARAEVAELIIAARHVDNGRSFAGVAGVCGTALVSFQPIDSLDIDSVAALLAHTKPDLVLQCASLLSPWACGPSPSPRARAIQNAGFGLQLPAQLPAIFALMRAARMADFRGPIVNCSYPDLTHPVLARLDLAPSIGIGNAGMIAAVVQLALRRGQRHDRVRVLAHHSHVTAVVTRDPSRIGSGPPPRVFLGDAGGSDDDLAYRGPAMASSRELNAISAVHGVDVALALLPGGPTLATSAPGPHGLPGGWPVQIREGRIELDLPSHLSQEAALRECEAAAVGDGIAAIDDHGTVHFTDAARHAMSAIAPELAAPLSISDCLPRAALLRRYLLEAM